MKKPKPLLTMDIAQRLLAGTYHDQEEDMEEDGQIRPVVTVKASEDLVVGKQQFQDDLQ